MTPFDGEPLQGEPLQGDSLLLCTKFPDVFVTYSFDRPWKDERLSQT